MNREKDTVDLDVKEADEFKDAKPQDLWSKVERSAKLDFFKAAKVDFVKVSNDEEDI